jgi:hypothetical protein
MKKTLLLAALIAAASGSAARAQSTFPDVPDNHWAAQAVRRLAEAGIVKGFPAQPKAVARTAKSDSRKSPAKVARRAKKSPAS